MNQLVRLRTRPSRDGKEFTYMLDYIDENGKRMRISLGHSDKRKAERQGLQLERELRMGIVAPASMKLSKFWEDSLMRTNGLVRQSTLTEHGIAMKHFIDAVGNIDYQSVKHKHGEIFVQNSLERGNSLATVNKKISGVKRLFQLAVERGQLEQNPFMRIRRLKVPKRKVRVYSEDECNRILKAARDVTANDGVDWELLIILALCTGMRRGELLNVTWHDIDFEKQAVEVSPKKETKHTWEWSIKDSERRVLPLTEEVISLLAKHQTMQLEGCPYLFVSPVRYEHIQKVRQDGKWSVRHGTCPINNFTRQFGAILKRAGIESGEFHDIRRTCLTRWLFNGLAEYDVMNLAGHADFSTTRNFYLGVREDLLERARKASAETLNLNFGTHLARRQFAG